MRTTMHVVLLLIALQVYETFGSWHNDTSLGVRFAPRSGHTAVALQNKYAIVYGGHVMNGYGNPVTYFSEEVWIFNKNSNSFTLKTPATFPGPRTFHAAVALSNTKMLIWGGGFIVDGITFLPTDEMWTYDMVANSWTQIFPRGNGPVGRLAPAMVRKDNRVFVFGGVITLSDGSCCDFLNDMYYYSISLNRWSQVNQGGEIPPARGYSQVVLRGHSMWMQGGEGADFNIEPGLWKYNINLNSWMLVNMDDPDVNNQRESQLFNIVGPNKFITFGGDTPGPEFHNLVNDTRIYNIDTDEWKLRNVTVRPPTAKKMPSVSFVNSSDDDDDDGDSDDEYQVWLFGGNTFFDLETGIEVNHNQVWYWTQ